MKIGMVDIEIDDPEVRVFLARGQRSRRAMIAARVRRGDLEGALDLYGHAERLDAVFRWFVAGRGPLRRPLAHAWTSAEVPGTSDAFYLILWRAIAAGERIDDGNPLPPGDPVTVYRGQATKLEDAGIAWTLSPTVARWFATTIPRVGPRQRGVVLSGRVARPSILGYLTARNEDEVIVDPMDVTGLGSERVVADRARAREEG